MTTKYIAYPWPEYQEYMGEEWFREECYYCVDKDVYFIPVNKVNESKNKEIRKDIISNLKRYINCIKDGYNAPSAKDFVIKEIKKQIAWLEKQNKCKIYYPQNHQDSNCPNGSIVLEDFNGGEGFYKIHLDYLNKKQVEEIEEMIRVWNKDLKTSNENIKDCIGMCLTDVNEQRFKDYGTNLRDCLAWIEKQGEQKPIDKVKPKFKVGDWVVFDNGNVNHITSVGTHGYTFDDGDYLLHDKCDKDARLWNIADAKNGDVLTWDDTSCVVLFKNIKNSKCFISYCFANDISFEIGTSHYIEGCHPATKEQRDLLFDKMKEDGYEWDAEKKELKKIDSEITIPFGAKDSELQETTYYIPKGFYAEIDDDKVVIKKGEKPAEWSEDDERIKKRLINLVNEIYDNTNYITFLEHKELLAWLEKLDDNIEL